MRESQTSKTVVCGRELALLAVFAAAVLGVGAALNQRGAVAAGSPAFSVPVKNRIDTFIQQKWVEEKLTPSGLCSDEEFLRRVYLDVAGVIPSGDTVQAFLNDRNPEKRAKAIDTLLKSTRYAEHWATLWGDLLREQSNPRGNTGTIRGSYREFLEEALAKNLPYDQFVKRLLLARGSADDDTAANFFLRDRQDRVETVNTISSVFMGTRMSCAQCHDHPFDKWQQSDFHSLMAYFSNTRVVDDFPATLLRMEQQKRLIPAAALPKFEPLFAAARSADARTKELLAHDEPGMGGMMGGPGMMADEKMMAPKEGSKAEKRAERKSEKGEKGEKGGMAEAAGGAEAGQAQLALQIKGNPRQYLESLVKGMTQEEQIKFRTLTRTSQVMQVLETGRTEYRMPSEGDGQNRKKTGEIVKPMFPWDPSQPVSESLPRREALFQSLVNNKQFAQVQVNRLWAAVMGRGLVDPLDDFRTKNPASHPELLDYLAEEFQKSKFDNQHILRLILNSSTYQLSTKPNSSNRGETTYYAKGHLRKMSAEQLFDSILVATGNTNGMADMPGLNEGGMGKLMKSMRGGREEKIQWAADVPAPAPTGSFLNTFNQPAREQTITARSHEGSITQALTLMNGTELQGRVASSPLLSHLIEKKADANTLVTELYLWTLGRKPTSTELAAVKAALPGETYPADAKNREALLAWRSGAEDALWALLNSREFIFIR